jgi:hypothetical protein
VAVGILVLILVVTWLLLIALLAIGTVAFQGYIYTEPVKNIEWRAPIAGSALTLFLIAWVIFDYNSPTNYQTLLAFNARMDMPPYKEFRVVTQEGKEEVYKQAKDARGRVIYLQDGRPDGRQPPGRPVRVIVKENNQDVTFEPDRDSKGHFKTETGLSLYYRDKKGRTMQEGQLGQASLFLTSNLLLNLLLNAVHFAVWFVVLWLVLDFRFWHAIGLAMAFWLLATLFQLPPLLQKVEEVAYQRTPVSGR